ncbi:MAG: ABC transporter permease [Candidatus Hodarchaeota archaeon]
MIKTVIKTLIYANKTLRETFRSNEKVGLIFAIPVILLVALAFMYGDQNTVIVTEDENILNIGVINWDDTSILLSEELKNQFRPYVTPINTDLNITGDPLETGFGQCFIENINMSHRLITASDSQMLSVTSLTDIDKAKTAVQSRYISLCFIITENFSQSLLAGVNYRTNITTGTSITNDPNLVRSEATVELIGDYSYSRFSQAENILAKMLKTFVQGYTEIELPAGKFVIKQEQINSVEFTEFHRYIPGFLVFVLLMSVSGSAGILALERGSGTLDRLKLSAYSPYSLVLGISITQIITTGLQIAVYLITIYFLGFPGQGDPVLAFLVGLISIPPILGIGLISAVIFEDEKLAMSLPGLGAIPLSFLTGSFLPLPRWPLFGEIEVWHLNPLYCTSEAIRKILFLNYDFSQVSVEVTFLLIIGSIMFLLSAFLFHKKVYISD